MTRHSPLIGLAAARSRYERAQEECPHWDYENPDGDGAPCCREMQEAEQEWRKLARRAAVP